MQANSSSEQIDKDLSKPEPHKSPPVPTEDESTNAKAVIQGSLDYAPVKDDSPKHNHSPVSIESVPAPIPIPRKPKLLLLIMLTTFLFVVLFALLNGGEGVDSLIGIKSCSLEWGALLMMMTIYCLSAASITWYIARRDITWRESRVMIFLGIALFGGIASGLLGIGGGLIVAPLLLEMGLIPEVTSASSSFLVLFTSSSTSIQFMINDMLNLEYASVLFCLSITASFIGVNLINRLVKNTNRPSIIVFILGILIGLSAILLPIFELVYGDLKDSSFRPIC